MKKFLLISVCFLLLFKAYPQISDDFSDGDFTSNPSWSGDVADFNVNTTSQLQLSASGAGESYLVTSNTIGDSVQWDFWIKLSFSPSANNNCRVYLVSDQQDIESGAVNGYFLQLGESGANDAVELFRQDGNSTTSVCRGTDGLIAGSFEMRLRVILNSNGNWDILADPAGGNNFQLEATGFDDTWSSTSYFGFSCNYTMSNSDKFYFDDISVQHYTPDTTPPAITSLTVLNKNEVAVEYSEPVTQASAENTNNYFVDKGIGNPVNAVQDAMNTKKINLAFANSFNSTQQYQLGIQNVKDLAGNSMQESHNFTYYQVRHGDVVIDEIMADPTPQVGLPGAEYIELYNQSTYPVSLNDWSIQVGDAEKSLSSVTIQPDSFLLLCDDDDRQLFTPYGAVVDFTSLQLTNSGATLVLKNDDGQIIHLVDYSDTWYKDDQKEDGGWSLEQMDPSNACGGVSNWMAADNLNGGTPGTVNSINTPNPDIEPPQIDNVIIKDSTQLLLNFSEIMDSVSIKTASFTVNNGVGAIQNTNAKAPFYYSVLLKLPTKIQSEVLYEITVEDTVTDCAGNAAYGLTFQFALYEAGFHDIIITEIMADPSVSTDLPDAEYIEFYNRSEFPINLKNWKFSYSGYSPKELSSHVILPDSFLILCAEPDYPELQHFGDVATISSMLLPNSGSELLLTDSLNRVITHVEYSGNWYHNDFKKNTGGWSMEMVDKEFPCVGYDNWRASKNPKGGTPGKDNSVASANPDQKVPEYISTMYVNPSLYVIELSETIDPDNLPASDKFEVEGMGQVLDATLLEPAYNRLQIVLPDMLKPDTVYNLIVYDSVTDCAGNRLEETNLPLALPAVPKAGDILINEVLFHEPDQTGDFVEIVNASGKPVYLYNQNLVYMDVDDYSDIDELALDQENRILFDGDIRCFTKEERALNAHYKRSIGKNIYEKEGFPALVSDNGILMLQNSASGTIVDSMKYSENMHNPLIKETKGISLERVSPDLSSVMNENWTSAAETAGFATPGFMNSQHNKIGEQQSGEVDTEYEMFSPNGDGKRDVLIINYKMDKPGYTGSLRIYDRNGRKVCELKNNVLMEKEGSFIWDGRSNDAGKAPVGIYLIYLEVFDADGNLEKYKTTTVLGGKLN
ncbi:MAG: lamin tail domain-containing protein [Bacteroidales bacterium]|nr:lamin tail domain-containing protein [Bacteroidales bacterium]MCF8326879.1 lamin tail domain-containing protein [Bacteroidales bacterium]